MKPLPGMEPFYSRFPEQAWRETRVIKVPASQNGLPADSYGFIESYCNEPDCDCRRVLLQVRPESRPGDILATINFGWETVEFYTDWMHGDAEAAHDIAEASLDPVNSQSELAPELLRLFRQLLLTDEAYVARLRRHYELFKRSQTAPRQPGPSKASRQSRRPQRPWPHAMKGP